MAIVEQNTFPQMPVPNQSCLNRYWHFHLNVVLGARSWSRLTGMLFPFQLGLSCENHQLPGAPKNVTTWLLEGKSKY